VVVDDADLLADCEAGPELSKIITRATGRFLALALAGDPDTLASGFGGWLADARRARRGCLTPPRPSPKGTSSASAYPGTAPAGRPGPAAPC
jgi:DNA segregation ATPase FtsK/SpoIIIE, S-DNA-T family